ncbi:putative reverse transcriptase domain-containing protein [Tanacetum coccineum]
MYRTVNTKVVFDAATFQDRALTWWNSQVATLGMEAVTRKTLAKMKVMMTEEFCAPEEIQRMEYELWNLKVKDMDISSYTTRFNELAFTLCPIACADGSAHFNANRRSGQSREDEKLITRKEVEKLPRRQCGEKGHIRLIVLRRTKPGRCGARGQAYDLSVVTRIRPSYEVELADGRKSGSSTYYYLRGLWCFVLSKPPIRNCDLMPIETGLLICISWDLPGLPPSSTTVEIVIEIDSVKFLGHMINSHGVYVDPAKVEAIKSWSAPKSPTELWSVIDAAVGRSSRMHRQLRDSEESYMTHDLDWRAELLSDSCCDIVITRGKAIRVADALSQERKGTQPLRNWARGRTSGIVLIVCGIHTTPSMSIFKKAFVNDDVVIPLDEVQLDNKLHFVEEPVEIMDREVKRLKQSRILIVKVRWNSRRGPEFTWEREDFFRSKYPHLFARRRVTRHDKRRDVAS